MNKVEFYKMHGLGNDYTYFNCVNVNTPIDKIISLVKEMSDRHCGIGSDGVVLILPSDRADIRMRMFNSDDGSEAEMCGNAVRCVAYLANKLGLVEEKMAIETIPGIIEAQIQEENVKVKMFYPPKVSVNKKKITSEDKEFEYRFVDVGNPHAVISQDEVSSFELEKYGIPIENNLEHFPNRVNVEFYEEIEKGVLQMRVWERGAGETMACGTGACATAGAYREENKDCNDIIVKMLGGDLRLVWENESFYMIGPVKFVFTGEIDLDNFC